MNTQTSINLWRIPTSTAAIQKKSLSAVRDVEQQLSHITQRFGHLTLENSLAIEDMALTNISLSNQVEHLHQS